MAQSKRWTIAAIKSANRASGGHFFDKETIKFWDSVALPNVYSGPNGVYFVTGDKSFSGTRTWWVRHFDTRTGKIGSVGDHPMASRAEALSTAKLSAGTKNPFPVGRSKSCHIRRLRNGRYQVRI